jgi:hypothetical protein
MQNPENITKDAEKIVLDLLPVKSRWKEINNVVIIDADEMLNYSHE